MDYIYSFHFKIDHFSSLGKIMINNEIVYLAERIENLPQISVFVFIKGLQSLTEAIKIRTEYS